MSRLPLLLGLAFALPAIPLTVRAEGKACCERPANRAAMLTGGAKPAPAPAASDSSCALTSATPASSCGETAPTAAPLSKQVPRAAGWLVPASTIVAGELGQRLVLLWLGR